MEQTGATGLPDVPADALVETWSTVYDKSLNLAEQIEVHCQKTGERFDAIVVIPRGSYYPANIISRELNFGATELLHASIASYPDDQTARSRKFKVGQMPPAELVEGKNLLIIEEVCDSGHTLKFINDYLYDRGAQLVRSGVLHYKPDKNETDVKPDWFVTETDKWIVYPWELNERRGQKSQARRR